MILTPEIEEKIIAAIESDPTVPTILPDHAYGKGGRVVVLVDGLPIDLHRHLHNVMIRPLGYHERMVRREGDDPRNVNPYLFGIPLTRKSTRTHCNKGHAYKGNEAPPNSRGYRCLTCLRDSRRKPDAGIANSRKTHCPKNHEYTKANTIVEKSGRRRCRTCKNTRNAAYMRRQRKEKP
ncbi:HNH endonuclease [Microbacterium phage RobinRose]|nr:HNH endonuclease [Microbacterium phage RobinRose]